jgi:hypothetical protein
MLQITCRVAGLLLERTVSSFLFREIMLCYSASSSRPRCCQFWKESRVAALLCTRKGLLHAYRGK